MSRAHPSLCGLLILFCVALPSLLSLACVHLLKMRIRMTKALIEVGRMESHDLVKALQLTRSEMNTVLTTRSERQGRFDSMLKMREGIEEAQKSTLEVAKRLTNSIEGEITSIAQLAAQLQNEEGAALNSTATGTIDSPAENLTPGGEGEGELRSSTLLFRHLANSTARTLFREFFRLRQQVDDTMLRLQRARKEKKHALDTARRQNLTDSKVREALAKEQAKLEAQISEVNIEIQAINSSYTQRITNLTSQLEDVKRRLTSHGVSFEEEEDNKGREENRRAKNSADASASNKHIKAAYSNQGPSSSTCQDDPYDQLEAAGVSCREIIARWGCEFDLSRLTKAPKGFRLKNICPRSCESCDDAVQEMVEL
eukprot:jgi/Bigna1/67598/fgenesh1_pg.4_\